MVAVMIGVDPHKGSHTAVVIGASEELLAQVRVRASAAQAERLLAWAAPWPERTWVVEGAGGLGHLLPITCHEGRRQARPRRVASQVRGGHCSLPFRDLDPS